MTVFIRVVILLLLLLRSAVSISLNNLCALRTLPSLGVLDDDNLEVVGDVPSSFPTPSLAFLGDSTQGYMTHGFPLV